VLRRTTSGQTTTLALFDKEHLASGQTFHLPGGDGGEEGPFVFLAVWWSAGPGWGESPARPPAPPAPPPPPPPPKSLDVFVALARRRRCPLCSTGRGKTGYRRWNVRWIFYLINLHFLVQSQQVFFF